MVERYHLALLGWAGALGLLGAVPGLRRVPPPPWWSRHVVGVLALFGALLGSAAGGWHRSAPWLLAAALCCAPADRDDRPHPLGRWSLLLAVVSVVGVWSAVPDTQAPLALVGAWAPLGAVWAVRGRALGPAATLAVVASILGSAWVGSAGWGAALASAVSVGMLLAAPLAAASGAAVVAGNRRAVLVAAHLLVALAVPRLLMTLAAPVAAGLAAGILVACVVLARVVGEAPTRTVAGGLRRT